MISCHVNSQIYILGALHNSQNINQLPRIPQNTKFYFYIHLGH